MASPCSKQQAVHNTKVCFNMQKFHPYSWYILHLVLSLMKAHLPLTSQRKTHSGMCFYAKADGIEALSAQLFLSMLQNTL